jgi:hypothetical protein
MASPIQIVLNPENYEEIREAGGGGGRKDFFAHRDAAFAAHRATLMGQIEAISGVLIPTPDARDSRGGFPDAAAM